VLKKLDDLFGSAGILQGRVNNPEWLLIHRKGDLYGEKFRRNFRTTMNMNYAGNVQSG
jgi:hypothetical protein